MSDDDTIYVDFADAWAKAIDSAGSMAKAMTSAMTTTTTVEFTIEQHGPRPARHAAPPSTAQIIRLLTATSALLHNEGWIVGKYRTESGRCLVGALRDAALGLRLDTDETNRLIRHTVTALARTAGLRLPSTARDCGCVSCLPYFSRELEGWNDRHSAQAVQALIAATIKVAECDQQTGPSVRDDIRYIPDLSGAWNYAITAAATPPPQITSALVGAAV